MRLNVNLNLGGTVTVAHVVQPATQLPKGRLTFTLPTITFTGVSPMAFTLASTSVVHAEVVWVDAGHNPAQVDGPTRWSTSAPTIATVVVDAVDSTKADVTSVGPLGPVQVVAEVDARSGTETKMIMATGDITVVAGEAVTAIMTFTP